MIKIANKMTLQAKAYGTIHTTQLTLFIQN